eukprot:1120045-Prymnesium_polylepis.1
MAGSASFFCGRFRLPTMMALAAAAAAARRGSVAARRSARLFGETTGRRLPYVHTSQARDTVAPRGRVLLALCGRLEVECGTGGKRRARRVAHQCWSMPVALRPVPNRSATCGHALSPSSCTASLSCSSSSGVHLGTGTPEARFFFGGPCSGTATCTAMDSAIMASTSGASVSTSCTGSSIRAACGCVRQK